MILDRDAIKPLLAGGQNKIVFAPLRNAPNAGEPIGLLMRRGHIVVRERWALPVVDGHTSIMLFEDTAPGKGHSVLAAPLAECGELRSAVFIPGSQNYYHFLMFNLPALFLLGGRADADLTLLTTHGFPPSADKFIRDTVIANVTDHRPVNIVQVPIGDYAVHDVIFRVVPQARLSVKSARSVAKIVWGLEGTADPLNDLGGIKIFIPRRGSTKGRTLLNQDEVQAWFEARGYVSVDPGALSIEQQIILFSRATHIAGTEGAAFANLLFAVAVKHVVMVANPMAMAEGFFPRIAVEMGFNLDMIAGNVVGENPTRGSDFTLPMNRLDEYEKGESENAAWLTCHGRITGSGEKLS